MVAFGFDRRVRCPWSRSVSIVAFGFHGRVRFQAWKPAVTWENERDEWRGEAAATPAIANAAPARQAPTHIGALSMKSAEFARLWVEGRWPSAYRARSGWRIRISSRSVSIVTFGFHGRVRFRSSRSVSMVAFGFKPGNRP
jgi:hypothetical protein